MGGEGVGVSNAGSWNEAAGIRVDAGASLTVTNSIVAACGTVGIVNEGGNPDDCAISHTALSANGAAGDDDDLVSVEQGAGILFADPLFTRPPGGDFSLRAGSPCVDAGVGQCEAEPEDAGGGHACDMGHLGNTAQGRAAE